MPEERVVLLEKWEPSYERRELSLVNPAKLRETIRTMGDQESAALWIYIGGDPEEVGYPVTPWLAVSTNRGMISVNTELNWDDFYALLGDASATDKVPFTIGGQEAPFPRRRLVSVEQAEAAALEFFRTGTLDVKSGGWERE